MTCRTCIHICLMSPINISYPLADVWSILTCIYVIFPNECFKDFFIYFILMVYEIWLQDQQFFFLMKVKPYLRDLWILHRLTALQVIVNRIVYSSTMRLFQWIVAQKAYNWPHRLVATSHPCRLTATHLNMGYPQISSAGTPSSTELQLLIL